MINKTVLVIVAVLAITAASYAAVIVLSDTYSVKLGQHAFNIPKQYSREGAIPQWLRNTPGMDDGSRAYLLEFSAKELAEAIPGYQPIDGRYQEDIRAILNVLTPVEVARYAETRLHHSLRELWEGTGSYRERIVEPYPDRPWFKIYRRIEYPHSWAVTTRSPESSAHLPESANAFWLAHCRSARSPITKSGKSVDCDSNVFYDDIAIDFVMSERNLHLIGAVRAYLKTKVESWREQPEQPRANNTGNNNPGKTQPGTPRNRRVKSHDRQRF